MRNTDRWTNRYKNNKGKKKRAHSTKETHTHKAETYGSAGRKPNEMRLIYSYSYFCKRNGVYYLFSAVLCQSKRNKRSIPKAIDMTTVLLTAEMQRSAVLITFCSAI